MCVCESMCVYLPKWNYLLEGGLLAVQASPSLGKCSRNPSVSVYQLAMLWEAAFSFSDFFFWRLFQCVCPFHVGDLGAHLPTPRWVFSSFWPSVTEWTHGGRGQNTIIKGTSLLPGSPCTRFALPATRGIIALNARYWWKGKELFIQKLYRFTSNDLMSLKSQSPLKHPQTHTVLPPTFAQSGVPYFRKKNRVCGSASLWFFPLIRAQLAGLPWFPAPSAVLLRSLVLNPNPRGTFSWPASKSPFTTFLPCKVLHCPHPSSCIVPPAS